MLTIFSDGGSRGNPGNASCAYVVYENDELILKDSKYLGITTNNVAEYNGVLFALMSVVDRFGKGVELKFNMDSELVVKQLNGLYKIKDKNLIELAMKVKKIINDSELRVHFVHILRAKNKMADALVNENLDENSRR
ncbi:MAG TPA: ribonuclease HI family protein [Candidatus Saccharimonadales bacterium]|nr:ribonuclease HI family protein [Candidatus Saccharimonadales bacterium]